MDLDKSNSIRGLCVCVLCCGLLLLGGCRGSTGSLNDLPPFDSGLWKDLQQEERARIFLPEG